MAIEDTLRALNGLKRRRVIRDYAIMGGVAAVAYMEPMFTEGVDVLILVNSDEEFLRAYRDIGRVADRIEGMHHVIAGTAVQLFPTTISPLYNDALGSARPVRVGNLRTKVVAVEHLILMFLQAFRPKDRIRGSAMLQEADEVRLRQLLQRFDDEKRTLAQRLENIRESGVPREGRI